MTAQELVNQGYGGYAGWSDAAAEADFNATGGAGKWTGGTSSSSGGGTPSVDDILNKAIDAVISIVPKPVTPYEQVNPFFFDEELARQAATAEYTPYYQEMLSDYIQQVETTKSRSQEDLNRTLEQLEAGKEYYMGTQRRLLDKALRNVNEGYAGRGLFFAGARKRDIGEMQTEYEAENKNYLTNYQYEKTGAELTAQRQSEDAALQEKLYTRDVEREQKAAIEAGVLQRENEVRQEYEAGRTAYYNNAQYGGLYNYG